MDEKLKLVTFNIKIYNLIGQKYEWLIQIIMNENVFENLWSVHLSIDKIAKMCSIRISHTSEKYLYHPWNEFYAYLIIVLLIWT